jgi:hypothetical protein
LLALQRGKDLSEFRRLMDRSNARFPAKQAQLMQDR